MRSALLNTLAKRADRQVARCLDTPRLSERDPMYTLLAAKNGDFKRKPWSSPAT